QLADAAGFAEQGVGFAQQAILGDGGRAFRDHAGTRRFSADCLPERWSVTRSNSIFWPSTRWAMPARSTARIWTNASLPPSSGWMNPKPFVALNHFTVPVGMRTPLMRACCSHVPERRESKSH